MVSISSKLALLFAGLALADSSSSSSSSFSAQSRTGAHLSHAPRNPLPERASGERAPLFGRPTTTDGSATEGKALRYALQQTRLNITEATAAAQRRWEHRMRRRIGEEEGGGAGLERREKWNWKHLEDYRGYLYFMEVEVGDPPQLVKLSPDTGSFETWMNPNCENSASPYLCVVNGMYHPENSELAVTQNEPFDFSYGNGWVNGKYYEDRIYFRNEDVGIRQKFGMATDSSYAVSGILGLGYGMGYTIGYSNVLDSLVKFDLINAPAYSVSLGGQGEGTSEIVFGGVNQAKYSGLLKAVPIWPSVAQQLPNYVHYRVNVTSFGFTKPTGAKTAFFSRTAAPLNVLVDTGVTYSLLPGAMVASIAEVFGAWWDVGEYKVDCALRDQAGTFDFGFNNDGLIIRVRYFDFILKLQDNTCTLGVQQGADNDAILGNTFLRGAYVVYDQLTHNLWMQNYKDCGSQVVEVGKKSGDVGQIKGLC